MNNDQLLQKFSRLYHSNYEVSIGDDVYVVTSTSVKSGHLDNIKSSFKSKLVQLNFPIDIEFDSGIKFLLMSINDYYEDNNIETIVKQLMTSDNLLKDNNITKMFFRNKRMDYLIIGKEDKQLILEILKSALSNSLVIEDTYGFVIFFDLEEEHDIAENIIATIEAEFYSKSLWVKGDTFVANVSVKSQLDELKEQVILLKKFSVEETIMEKQYILPYRLIGSLPVSVKNKLLENILNIHLDHELYLTVEKFFQHNLNLTDTAKALYIHRNTLIYRLEKILKITGFDLRNFTDVFVFRLIWLLTKELK